jgi:hypothetical protein
MLWLIFKLDIEPSGDEGMVRYRESRSLLKPNEPPPPLSVLKNLSISLTGFLDEKQRKGWTFAPNAQLQGTLQKCGYRSSKVTRPPHVAAVRRRVNQAPRAHSRQGKVV